MKAPSFKRWLLDMRAAGLAKSDAQCAELLGVSPNAVVKMKARGADERTALACTALLHRMKGYE